MSPIIDNVANPDHLNCFLRDALAHQIPPWVPEMFAVMFAGQCPPLWSNGVA